MRHDEHGENTGEDTLEPDLETTDSSTSTRLKPRKSARNKIMDLLARRDHSELELRRKLSVHYEHDDVEDAIRFARENKWLKAPDELAELVAEQLGRRNKGSRYIRNFLQTRGLPQVPRDLEDEIRKGLELVKIKLDREPPFEYDEQVKIQRLLRNRGFDDETIRACAKAKGNAQAKDRTSRDFENEESDS